MFNNQFNRKNHRNNYKRKTHERRCPYCGEQVVYDENERGADIGFGDLGPWPRHHCQAFLKCRSWLCLHLWYWREVYPLGETELGRMVFA